MRTIVGYAVVKVEINVPDENDMSDLDILDLVGSNCDYKVEYNDEETSIEITDTEFQALLEDNPT